MLFYRETLIFFPPSNVFQKLSKLYIYGRKCISYCKSKQKVLIIFCDSTTQRKLPLMTFLLSVCVDRHTVPCSLSTAVHYISFPLRGVCIAVFVRNDFKLLCKQSFKYKPEMIHSLLPSEEFQLLDLFACMAPIKFSCV